MTDYAFTPNQTDMDSKESERKKECSNSINANDLFSGTKEQKEVGKEK
jgi:hypothetical protein